MYRFQYDFDTDAMQEPAHPDLLASKYRTIGPAAVVAALRYTKTTTGRKSGK